MNPNENPNCVFCRIIGGDEMVSVIHEDEEVIAFLDVQPLHPGHVLVMPKAHYKNLFYVPAELAGRTFEVARRILPGLRSATGCRAVNLFSPNGADGGQDVFHFHLHLIPVPQDAAFPLQLPDPSAPVPSRSQLDVWATRIGHCIHEREGCSDLEEAQGASADSEGISGLMADAAAAGAGGEPFELPRRPGRTPAGEGPRGGTRSPTTLKRSER